MLPLKRFSILYAATLAFGMLSYGVAADAWAEASKPNVILIMADDISWECIGCYGAEDYKTPRIDELARRGVRFKHCYSTPICTTSRVKLMTGKYNFRNYTHFGYLNPAEKTFGNLMQDAGYKTAIAGKWQLNGLTNKLPGYEDSTRPNKAGFNEYMLWQLTRPKSSKAGGGERFWSPVLEHNSKLLMMDDNQGKYGPDMLCDFVCDFIDRNKQDPFFVYYPMVLVHDPFVPTPDTIGERSRGHETNKAVRSEKKENFVAMVNYMDKIVGRITDRLESHGLLENTIILFTADNGTNVAITSQWAGRSIKGGKGGMKDMGTHVPLVAYWKGHTPEGLESNDLIEFTDFYPTLAQAANIELSSEDPIDGYSFFRTLDGTADASTPKRDWVLTHYQPYWNKQPGQFVRNQEFKLYRNGGLFDIGSGDLEESNDLLESASGRNEEAKSALVRILNQAPPPPVGKGNKDTKKRPTYPDWKALLPK